MRNGNIEENEFMIRWTRIKQDEVCVSLLVGPLTDWVKLNDSKVVKIQQTKVWRCKY